MVTKKHFKSLNTKLFIFVLKSLIRIKIHFQGVFSVFKFYNKICSDIFGIRLVKLGLTYSLSIF